MKKGFTLVELIGVVTILAIIALLAMPIIDNAMKENREKMYQMQIDSIKEGLKNWATDNTALLPSEGDEIVLTLDQLKKGNYVKKDIKNPNDNQYFANDMVLAIRNFNGNYIYDVDSNTVFSNEDNYNESAPSIVMNGPVLVKVGINGSYVDEGVTVILSSGNAGTASAVITKDDVIFASINTSVMGKYIITYTATDGIYTTILKRTVLVEDTNPPELTVPSNTSILVSEVGTYNIMTGVLATDDSGETITPISAGSISAIPGDYVIIYTATDSSNNTVTKKRTIKVDTRPLYVDSSGASYPELYDSLIPIKYEQGNWYVADLYSKWYDYDAKEWANAILVSSSVRSIYVAGKQVIDADVLAYFVWIPRFSYQLWNTNNQLTNPASIDVVFEEINDPVANGSIDGERITHPAFQWDNNSNGVNEPIERKNGIWVGKYETSADNTSTCYSSSNVENCNITTITPMIKPNTPSWRNINVSNMYQVALTIKDKDVLYGFNSGNMDTHVMKNAEWGAVAYLSHSKYGIVGNIGKNNNSNYITGCGVASPGTASSSSCNGYNTSIGKNASTTGNVYGVYDMSGGAYEYVMGNESSNAGDFNYGQSGFTNTIPSKYYNNYGYSTSNNTALGIIGDATREVKLSASTSWYGQNMGFTYNTNMWFRRGGLFSETTTGLFAYNASTGASSINTTFRVVII